MTEIPTITQPDRIPADWRTRHELHRRGLRPKDRHRPDCWIPFTDNREDDKPCGLWAPESTEQIPAAPSRQEMRDDRRATTEWAREALDPANDYVVIDTETTSLREGHVIEIAAVDCQDQVVFEVQVCPHTPIEAAATKVHGITDGDVADKLRLYSWARQISEKLEGRRIIAWNGSFDQEAIARSLAESNMKPPEWLVAPWWDAMRQHAKHVGIWDPTDGRYRTHALDGGHRAVADCRAVWARIREMANTGAHPETLELVESTLRRELDRGRFRGQDGEDAVRHAVNIVRRIMPGTSDVSDQVYL